MGAAATAVLHGSVLGSGGGRSPCILRCAGVLEKRTVVISVNVELWQQVGAKPQRRSAPLGRTHAEATQLFNEGYKFRDGKHNRCADRRLSVGHLQNATDFT